MWNAVQINLVIAVCHMIVDLDFVVSGVLAVKMLMVMVQDFDSLFETNLKSAFQLSRVIIMSNCSTRVVLPFM